MQQPEISIHPLIGRLPYICNGCSDINNLNTINVLHQNKNGEVLIVTLLRKSHWVAHEKSESWWVLLMLLYNIQCYCQISFVKKQQSLFVLEAVLSFTFINS